MPLLLEIQEFIKPGLFGKAQNLFFSSFPSQMMNTKPFALTEMILISP